MNHWLLGVRGFSIIQLKAYSRGGKVMEGGTGGRDGWFRFETKFGILVRHD